MLMTSILKRVEQTVRLDETILTIRSMDANAPDEKEIKRFCMEVSKKGKAILTAVTGMIINRMLETGKTAREVMKEMGEQVS